MLGMKWPVWLCGVVYCISRLLVSPTPSPGHRQVTFGTGVVAFGDLNSCELGVFQFEYFLMLLLRLILNKHC